MDVYSIVRPVADPPVPLTITPEPWVSDAACRGSRTPDVWFPHDSEPADAAKKVCGGCPVAGACLDYALRSGEKHGVWGGLTPWELERLRRQART